MGVCLALGLLGVVAQRPWVETRPATAVSIQRPADWGLGRASPPETVFRDGTAEVRFDNYRQCDVAP